MSECYIHRSTRIMYSAIVSILNTCDTSFGMRIRMGISSSGTVLLNLLRHGEWFARAGRLAKMKYDLAPLVFLLSGMRKLAGWITGKGLGALRTLLPPSRHAHVVIGSAKHMSNERAAEWWARHFCCVFCLLRLVNVLSTKG